MNSKTWPERVGDNIKCFETPLKPWEIRKDMNMDVMLCLLKMIRNYSQIDWDVFLDHPGDFEPLSNLSKLISWPNLKKIQVVLQFVVIQYNFLFHQIWKSCASIWIRLPIMELFIESSDPWGLWDVSFVGFCRKSWGILTPPEWSCNDTPCRSGCRPHPF